MSTQTAVVVDVDFHSVPKCEGKHGECTNEATLIVTHDCPACHSHHGGSLLACDPCWETRDMEPIHCSRCHWFGPHGVAWTARPL